MTVGEKIRDARESKSFTQRQVGEGCGFSGRKAQIYVARWEAGTRPVPQDKIKALAHLLGIPLEQLIP